MYRAANRRHSGRPGVLARRARLLRPPEFAAEDKPTFVSPEDGEAATVYTRHPSRPVRFMSLGMHQQLTKLQAVAGRIAKRSKFDHTRNFFNLAFERNTAGLQASSFVLNIRYLQHHRCAGFLARARIYGQPDRRFSFASGKFRPLLRLKRLFQS